MTNITINDAIAETLLIPLYGRAEQSQRPNPIIYDESAIALVKKIPYDFSPFANKPKSSVGCAVRARFFDQKCIEFIQKHPDGVIVNLGCGLDARLQRLGDIAKNVPFYSLDIAESIQLREKWLPALANETYLSSSMFDTDWLDMLAQKHPKQPVLLIAEGVMMYFDAQKNQAFMRAVADRLDVAYLYFDCPSVFFSKQSRRHDTVSQTRAEFAFGLDDPKALEAWDSRWHYLSHAYFADFKEVWQMGKIMAILMEPVPLFQKSFVMIGYRLGE